MEEPQSRPVKIVNSVPAITADGHGLGINPESGVANLVFIQIVMNQAKDEAEAKQLAEGTKDLEGNAVSSIRMTMEQLEKLGQDITAAVKDFKPKQPK